MPLLRPGPLPSFLIPGKLFLTSMPGRFNPLDEFLQEIQASDIQHILCLVTDEEIAEYSPEYLDAIHADDLPAKLWRHPIPDFGIPENRAELDQTIGEMRKLLLAGNSLVIHCAAGIGRTGMVAIMLLIRLGFTPHIASRTIELAGSAPDTQAQRDLF